MKNKFCKPIEILLDTLINNGFKVIESKVSDFHFHEVFIRLKGENANAIKKIDIDKIKKVDNKTFSCECHWSIVEINTLE